MDAEKKVCDVLTDRDIYVALGTRNQTAGEVRVEEVAQKKVYACHPGDDVRLALQTMREGHVRRLPVVDANKNLEGVVSMDDILLHAEPNSLGNEPELSANEVVRQLPDDREEGLAREREKGGCLGGQSIIGIG